MTQKYADTTLKMEPTMTYTVSYNQAVNVIISTKLNNLYHYKELVVRLSNWLQTNITYIIAT